jgi:hypothetical protein
MPFMRLLKNKTANPFMKIFVTFLISFLLTGAHFYAQFQTYKKGDLYICQNDDGTIIFDDQDSLRKSAYPYETLFLSAKNGLFTVYQYNRTKGMAEAISEPKYTQYYYNLDVYGPHIVMIDSVGMKYNYFFGGDSFEMNDDIENTGLNTAGKYGLFNNGEEILAYQFDDLHDAFPTNDLHPRPTSANLGIYEAQLASGKMYYDKNGTLLFPDTVNFIIPFKNYPGTYGVQKGDRFGFFSENKTFYSPLLSYQDIKRRFQTYGVMSYCDLATPYVILQDGKRKVIDQFQNELLPPIYEKAFLINKNQSVLTFKDSQWSVLSLKTKKIIGTLDIELWIGESYSYRKLTGFYVLDGKVKGFNSSSFKEVKRFDFANDAQVTAYLTAEHHEMAFDTEGNIIIPAGKYKEVSKFDMNGIDWFLVTNLENKVGIVNMENKEVVELQYDDIQVSYNPKNHLILTENGWSAIAVWQVTEPFLKVITEFEYHDVKFLGYHKSIMATGKTKSGKECNILFDGTVKIK